MGALGPGWRHVPAALSLRRIAGGALDGYNWGTRFPSFGGWRGFRRTFSSSYRRLSRLGPQPVWIAEVGSSADGGDKAAWVRDMFRTAPKMRRLRGIV